MLRAQTTLPRAGLWLALMLGTILGSGPSRAAPEGSPWGRDYFPNVTLQTQDGQSVRFYDDLIKDKVVAINFIFTGCTESCPVETANLKRVQKMLGERMGKDVFFYSISIDPRHDTPASLKSYADKFKVGPGWTFLTGKAEDITLLRKKLGLYRDDAEGRKMAGHSISLIVGNEATGRWIKRSPFDEPKLLARMLGSTLPQITHAGANRLSYASATEVPVQGKGERLYNSRCASCHSLGNQDGIGPGMAGVTQKRDRAWLERWLENPAAMIAGNDPVAVALYRQFNQVMMPNLKLDKSEIAALLEYLETSGALAQRD